MAEKDIRVIVGLGNPGPRFYDTRHNIGFRVLDVLAERHGGVWRTRDNYELCQVAIQGHDLLLVKPQTFMNNSGQVLPHLRKQGIQGAHNILVVHDELEKPFGSVTLREGGSARGHNGLKSIISIVGENFSRVRCGIGRPEDKAQVPDYVLQCFTEQAQAVDEFINRAADIVEKQVAG